MTQRLVKVALFGLASCITIGLTACTGTQAPQTHADIATPINARQACASKHPLYPEHARRVGEQGVVRVAVLVGADGSFF
jgi:outer membrane biosynthesis protein TonB